MEKLNRIKGLLPIGYVIIILFGYYFNWTYYKYFDIEIFNYLNLTELLFPSFVIGVSLIIGFPTILIVILSNILITGIPKIKNELRNEKPKKNKLVRFLSISIILRKLDILNRTKTKSKMTKFKIILLRLFILLSILLLILFYLWPIFLMMSNLEIFNYSIEFGLIIITTFFWIIIFYLKAARNEFEDKKGYLISLRYLVLLIYSIPFIWSINKHNAKLVLEGVTNKGFIINKKNKEIRSSDTLILIGQTQDFIFLRNTKLNHTIIIKNSDIEEISFFKKIK